MQHIHISNIFTLVDVDADVHVHAEYRMWNVGCGMWDAGCRMQIQMRICNIYSRITQAEFTCGSAHNLPFCFCQFPYVKGEVK
jgi:hypothetical protein